jgi:hypothetical protein
VRGAAAANPHQLRDPPGDRFRLMDNVEKATLARVCRQQASLASCREVRDALLDLAVVYDTQADASLAPDLEEFPGEQREWAVGAPRIGEGEAPDRGEEFAREQPK